MIRLTHEQTDNMYKEYYAYRAICHYLDNLSHLEKERVLNDLFKEYRNDST